MNLFSCLIMQLINNDNLFQYVNLVHRMKSPKSEKLLVINCIKVWEEEFQTNVYHWISWDIMLWLVRNKTKD